MHRTVYDCAVLWTTLELIDNRLGVAQNLCLSVIIRISNSSRHCRQFHDVFDNVYFDPHCYNLFISPAVVRPDTNFYGSVVLHFMLLSARPAAMLCDAGVVLPAFVPVSVCLSVCQSVCLSVCLYVRAKTEKILISS